MNNDYKLWQESLRRVASSNDGVKVLSALFANMGYFGNIFTTGAAIYKNAALADLAKWLESELDIIDHNLIASIKTEYKNSIKIEKNERRDEDGRTDY